jgi:hypothetical protein
VAEDLGWAPMLEEANAKFVKKHIHKILETKKLGKEEHGVEKKKRSHR